MKHRSAESEGLGFDSSWELKSFLNYKLVTRRTPPFVFLSLLIRCIFKRKNIVIIIRLQAIIMMNTLAHKEKEAYFQGVVTFEVNCDISTV